MKNKLILGIISFTLLPALGCGLNDKSSLNRIDSKNVNFDSIYYANFYIENSLYETVEFTREDYFDKKAPDLPQPNKGYYNYWYPEVDFSKFEDSNYDMMTTLEFRVRSGGLDYSNDSFHATTDSTLAILNSSTFDEGTLSMNLTKSIAKEDSGIIFSITFDNKEPSTFWETPGVSYYFFYINQAGAAVLSKINNGKYKTLTNVALSSKTQYQLQVVKKENTIDCYVDETKVISYVDENILKGDKVGFRLHKATSYINDFYVTEDFPSKVPGFICANGDAEKVGNNINILEDKTLFYNNKQPIINKEYKVSLKQNNCGDIGVIFGLDPNITGKFYEDNVSYLYLYLSAKGVVTLEKLEDNSKQILNSYAITDFNSELTYSFSAVIVNARLRCLLDGKVLFTYTNASSFVDTLYGFKATVKGSVIGFDL